MLSAAPAAEPLIEQARRALAESVPEVAIQKLRSALAGGQLSSAQRQEAARKLGEALLEPASMTRRWRL